MIAQLYFFQSLLTTSYPSWTVREYWHIGWDINAFKVQREEKHSARINVKYDKLYTGKEMDVNEFEVYSKIIVFLEILFIGNFVAVLAFLWEINLDEVSYSRIESIHNYEGMLST